MIRHVMLAGAVVVAAVWAAGVAAGLARADAPSPPGQSAQTPQTPTFRTAADVVFLDVSVRRGGAPVTGLRAEDFDLRDNGVRQKVEAVDAAAVPIDLTLLVDVSSPPRTPMGPPGSDERAARRVTDDLNRILPLLRPDDRGRVLTIDTYVHQIAPLQPASALLPIRAVTSGGLTSMYDALIAALLQPVDPDRRHVVIAGVKNRDTLSTMDAVAVRDVAARSDALLHIVSLETLARNEAMASGARCGMAEPDPAVVWEQPARAGEGICQPTARSWMPHAHELLTDKLQLTEKYGVFIKAAADATRGAFHQGVLMSEPTMAGTFAQAFEDFRQSYILRYVPVGVTREGWHSLTVTVPGQKDARVRARSGYAIDRTPPPAPAKTGAPAALRTMADLTAAYVRGDQPAVAVALRAIPDPTRVIQEFLDADTPWPGTLTQEATFVLELAEAGLFSPRATAKRAAADLLTWYTKLVRHPIDPDAFERAWLTAELSLLQGRINPATAAPFVDSALLRFPAEPRFVLAKAMMADQLWRGSGSIGDGPRLLTGQTPAAHAATVRERYEAAAAFPETEAEARIRLGWFLHRVGLSNNAVAEFDRVAGRSQDPALEHVRLLFRGHALVALGRQEDAMTSYRDASAVLPDAQSARVALMNQHAIRGETAAAAALAADIETTQPSLDPWWTYWLGDYRWYQQALDAVKAIQR